MDYEPAKLMDEIEEKMPDGGEPLPGTHKHKHCDTCGEETEHLYTTDSEWRCVEHA